MIAGLGSGRRGGISADLVTNGKFLLSNLYKERMSKCTATGFQFSWVRMMSYSWALYVWILYESLAYEIKGFMKMEHIYIYR